MADIADTLHRSLMSRGEQFRHPRVMSLHQGEGNMLHADPKHRPTLEESVARHRAPKTSPRGADSKSWTLRSAGCGGPYQARISLILTSVAASPARVPARGTLGLRRSLLVCRLRFIVTVQTFAANESPHFFTRQGLIFKQRLGHSCKLIAMLGQNLLGLASPVMDQVDGFPHR